jgi:glycosyltransferase involved in cell wall biosynthesis
MRVLQVVTFVGSTGKFGGPPTVALGQLSALIEHGHDAELVALASADEASDRTVEGVPAHLFRARTWIPGPGLLGLCNVRLVLWLWRSVRRYDIVHVHAGRDLVTVVSLSIARLRGVPYVCQTHGMIMPRTSPPARLFDRVLRPLLRHAGELFVLTDEETVGLSAVTRGMQPRRIANGVPVVVPAEPRELPSPPTIVFLARLHPRKRVMAFVEMAELLVSTGWSGNFVIYGPDEGSLPDVRARIADLAVCSYAGAVDHPEALRVLGGAAVYVLSSVDEPFPMSLLEALAAGTPVICTDSCGIAEALRGRPGSQVTNGEPAELAASVRMFTADPPTWASHSAGARTTAEQLFSLDAVVTTLVSTYSRVVGSAGAP